MSSFVPARAGAALLPLLLAAPLQAQQLSHSTAVGLGLAQIGADGETASGGSFDIESSLRAGKFDMDIAAGVNQLSDDGDSLTHTGFQLAPGYWVTDMFKGGLYVEKDHLSLDGLGDLDTLSYGLDATVRGGGIEAGLFFGETDLEGVAMNDIGLRAQADIGESASLWGSTMRSRFDGASGDTDVHSTTIGGSVLAANGIGAFASYQSIDFDNSDLSANVASLGVSYTAQVAGQAVMFSGEYANATGSAGIDLGEGDRISLGATILLGDAKRKRTPANSVANSSLGTPRNAVTSAYGALGF